MVPVALLLILSGHAAGASSPQPFSAKCSDAHSSKCIVYRGEEPGAHASGHFEDDIAEQGWGRLLVRTPSSKPGLPAFAAGYLEGYLTADRIVQHMSNAFKEHGLNSPPPGVLEFMRDTDEWWRRSAQQAAAEDHYWVAAGFVRDQLDGLTAGLVAKLEEEGAGGRTTISRTDLLLLNSLWDIDDIKKAVNVSERANFAAMDAPAISEYARKHGHCSALVKLLPDGSDIFVGHNTWSSYGNMLRIFKRYEFGTMQPVAMPSYPGVLYSTDDFYQIGHLVVLETTLPSYNNDLFGLVQPNTMLYWVRNIVANMVATTGPEWMELFKRYNSGTYSNMWMVVDYNKFIPGKPLTEGVLTVGEQLPGYFHHEDQSRVLSYGYWPSYNAAVYPETAHLLKQDVMAETLGDSFSYQLVERAQIFRRDQASVGSDGDMQRVMLYNRFQTDPIAQGDACKQIACRSDLAAAKDRRQAFGAIDAKYTSSAHVRAGRTVVISGPTHDDQPAFDWRTAGELATTTPHLGHPDVFDFPWVVMDSELAARPWPAPEGQQPEDASWFSPLVAGAFGFAVIAITIGGFVASRPHYPGLAPDLSYKKLQGSRAEALVSTSTACRSVAWVPSPFASSWGPSPFASSLGPSPLAHAPGLPSPAADEQP